MSRSRETARADARAPIPAFTACWGNRRWIRGVAARGATRVVPGVVPARCGDRCTGRERSQRRCGEAGWWAGFWGNDGGHRPDPRRGAPFFGVTSFARGGGLGSSRQVPEMVTVPMIAWALSPGETPTSTHRFASLVATGPFAFAQGDGCLRGREGTSPSPTRRFGTAGGDELLPHEPVRRRRGGGEGRWRGYRRRRGPKPGSRVQAWSSRCCPWCRRPCSGARSRRSRHPCHG